MKKLSQQGKMTLEVINIVLIEEKYGLLKRVRQGMGKPDRLYVLKFIDIR